MDALTTVITAVVSVATGGGLGAWLLKMWQQKHQFDKEDGDDVWRKQAEIIERQDKQIATLQAEQQRALVAEMTCRQEVAKLQSLGQWLYELLRSLHTALDRMGGEPDPLPEFPEFAKSHSAASAEREFAQRSTEHGTGLVREEAKESKQQNTPPTK